jgi:hypothetical protein
MPLDPMVLDASAINDAGEFEMMLFDNDTWDSSQEHQRQLQAKVEAYMEVATDSGFALERCPPVIYVAKR